MKRPKQRHGTRSGCGCPTQPMYFADDPLDLEVVSIDNRRAKPLDPEHCAYACAGERIYGVPFEIGRKFSYAYHPGFVVKYVTSALMQRQLTANDQGGTIFPGTYRLGAIPPSMRRSRIQGKVRGAGGGRKDTARLGPNEVRRRAAA